MRGRADWPIVPGKTPNVQRRTLNAEFQRHEETLNTGPGICEVVHGIFGG